MLASLMPGAEKVHLLEEAGLSRTETSTGRRLGSDGSAVCITAASQSSLVHRRAKQVSGVGAGSGREYFTVLCVGSESGELPSPFVLCMYILYTKIKLCIRDG